MKKHLFILAICAISTSAQAQVYHQGYYNHYGTYVAPHYQSAPNNTPYDNYSTQGNVNPFTGQAGTVNPQPVMPQIQAPMVPSYQYRGSRYH